MTKEGLKGTYKKVNEGLFTRACSHRTGGMDLDCQRKGDNCALEKKSLL